MALLLFYYFLSVRANLRDVFLVTLRARPQIGRSHNQAARRGVLMMILNGMRARARLDRIPSVLANAKT